MFIGEHAQKVDTKGRVVVPVKFRDELGNHVVVTRGLDGCLFAYSRETFTALAEKLSSLPLTDKKVSKFNRFFLAGARDLEADKLGRVLLPSVLRDHASIEKDAVWVGVGNRIEIWDLDKWNAQMADYLDSDEAEENLDELAEYMAELGI